MAESESDKAWETYGVSPLWEAYRTGHCLVRLVKDFATWSQAIAGTDQERGPIGPLKHLAKEAVEAQEKPDDITEYADCLLLLLDASRRAGFSVMEVIEAAAVKLEVNKLRTWLVPVSDEPVEHVKETI